MHKRVGLIGLAIVMLALISTAAKADEIKPRALVTESRLVIEKMMADQDNGIPHDLLKKAAGVVIFPSVVKGGFIIGGTYGRGVVLSKNPKGFWSPPGFVDFGGGSFGFQIGVQSIELVLVVMNRKGLKSLLNTNFKLGADIGVAAGPVGRRAEASTDGKFDAKVLSYSRTKGLFAGFSLEGAGIAALDDYTQAYYGRKFLVEEIIFDRKAIPPKTAKDLMAVMTRYTK